MRFLVLSPVFGLALLLTGCGEESNKTDLVGQGKARVAWEPDGGAAGGRPARKAPSPEELPRLASPAPDAVAADAPPPTPVPAVAPPATVEAMAGTDKPRRPPDRGPQAGI